MNNFWIALGLTVFAGMGTGVGAAVAFFAKRTNFRFLSIATGFSAGVMIYVSFVEIFFKGVDSLTAVYGEKWGHWVNAGAFFGGILLIGLIDNLIPEADNPHETHSEAEIAPLHDDSAPVPDCYPVKPSTEFSKTDIKKLNRMGLFTAIAITIHNFPEGLATFMAAIDDPSLGITIAIAIALHNIPEGISVSVPIFYATGNRKKAFIYSFLSGLAEPVGALIAYFILMFFISGKNGVVPHEITGILFGVVAGIMVYISVDELLPTSRAYGKGHDSIIGLVTGMAVMALSLLLIK